MRRTANGWIVALLMVSAFGAQAADRDPDEMTTMLILDLAGTEVKEGQIRTYTDLLATSWSRFEGLNVLTSKDLAQAMDVEAQKKALGCDDSGCLAEIAGALGADYVALGSVGILGQVNVFNLSLYDAKNARSMTRQKFETRNLEEVSRHIDESVSVMGQEALGFSAPAPDGSALRPVMLWGGVALGVVGVGGAIAFTALAYGQETELSSGRSSDHGQSLAVGRLFTGLAIGAGVLGAAGLGLAGFGLVSE
jgi:hypothetical protein